MNCTSESSTWSCSNCSVQQRSESITRQRTEEGNLAAQSADGPRRVERAAAELGSDRTVGIDDQIDQGLAADDDHRRP